MVLVFGCSSMLQKLPLLSGLVVIFARVGLAANCSSYGGNRRGGHKMPFGFCGPHLPVDEVVGWPLMSTFTEKYVKNQAPLLMKHAAEISPAFRLWTDEYFASLDLADDARVTVETRKKEDRALPASDMHFSEWVKTYKQTDNYMIEDMPYFLSKDVLYPGPLQCDNLRKYLIKTLMWFSSGGTKSVAHTDLSDNIICVFRGTKTFVMVDPHKHGHKVPINRSFSPIDVDSVDFEKYPKMADNVEYYNVNISAGDCLYVPYMWIHQVNSYGSNIAVNFWWSHYGFLHNEEADSIADCDRKPECWLTTHPNDLTGNDQERDYPFEILDIMRVLVVQSESNQLTSEQLQNIPKQGLSAEEKSYLDKAFKAADTDKDGVISIVEIDKIQSDKTVGDKFRSAIRKLARLVKENEKRSEIQNSSAEKAKDEL
ncbi:tRNA wybutosine-synthesizing protein 5-like [Tubulanus polymorphus]|uniref:tRNA wybutosine-synthesizing protein 5-like n=1 Tax=Tubulanus polymorphus TaxID=672921 RepID=UPI003DA36C18